MVSVTREHRERRAHLVVERAFGETVSPSPSRVRASRFFVVVLPFER